MKRAALLSVSDRTGIVPFARALSELGYVLLATSGTAKILNQEGVETLPIEQYTGQKEILDGRVKTLHPKIHAGLLAKRDNPQHMAQLEADGIMPIDVAAVNLYPFIQNLGDSAASNPAKMVELIDIGGPTMIRASAKNFSGVIPVIDPADYETVVAMLRERKQGSDKPSPAELEARRRLSVKVFTALANYNLEIARYFSQVHYDDACPAGRVLGRLSAEGELSEVEGMVLTKAQELRYGENPHQTAALYRPVGAGARSWQQLNGKELSYNNLLDFDAALRLVRSLDSQQPAAVIMKHLNPCGAAYGAGLLDALKKAKRGDPRSHFGGVLGFNQTVTIDVAREIREDFAEIVLAPGFEPDALEFLRGNKNLRVLRVDAEAAPAREARIVEGGVLLQGPDRRVSDVREAKLVSKRTLDDRQYADLQFAWSICAHVKSNAITLAKDGMLLAVGAGQMSRIDSVELALSKARRHEHGLGGAVAASDAFFPFPDSVETLASAGISAIIAPSGAKRDQEAIDAADRAGVALVFASDRHFRH